MPSANGDVSAALAVIVAHLRPELSEAQRALLVVRALELICEPLTLSAGLSCSDYWLG